VKDDYCGRDLSGSLLTNGLPSLKHFVSCGHNTPLVAYTKETVCGFLTKIEKRIISVMMSKGNRKISLTIENQHVNEKHCRTAIL
jgi:hypothetical protein